MPSCLALFVSLVFAQDDAFTERKLATIPEDITPNAYSDIGMPAVLSPDLRVFAYVGLREGKQHLMLGDKRGDPYDRVYYPTFSPDGKQWAGEVIAGGERDGLFHKGGQRYVLVNGKRSEAYDDLKDLSFSPDGKHFGHSANKGGRWFAVIDGKKGEDLADMGDLAFGAEGRFAYGARQGDDWFVVTRDGKAGPFAGVGLLQFSPDGKRLAYRARNTENREWLVLDGKKVTDELWSISEAVFLSDGSDLACLAQPEEGGPTHVVLRGKKGPAFPSASGLVVGPDGLTCAYTVRQGENEEFVVVGDRKGKSYKGVYGVKFLADGKSVAYDASKGDSWIAIVDGKEGPAYPLIQDLVVSPDGKTVAVWVNDRERGVSYVVAGDKKSGEFEQIWNPVFSPDGRKLGFAAMKDNEIWWRVIDVAPPQESAEELFRKFEKKYLEAPCLSYRFKAEWNITGPGSEKGTFAGRLRSKFGNRYHLESSLSMQGQTVDSTIHSDGKKALQVDKLGAHDEPVRATAVLAGTLTRYGITLWAVLNKRDLGEGDKTEPKLDDLVKVSGFRFLDPDSTCGKTGRIIEYTVKSDAEFRLKLWLDAADLKPMRRVLVFKDGERELTCTETYEEVSIAEIPDATFGDKK